MSDDKSPGPGPDIENHEVLRAWGEYLRNVIGTHGSLEVIPGNDGRWFARASVPTVESPQFLSIVHTAAADTMAGAMVGAIDRVIAWRIANAKARIRELAREELARVRREHDLPPERERCGTSQCPYCGPGMRCDDCPPDTNRAKGGG